MTAPVRSDPTIVKVALGARSYDIVIGRGVIASLGARIAALRPGAKTFIVTDENVARHLLAAAEAALAHAGVAASHVDRSARRGIEELSRFRASLRSHDRLAHRARRSCHRARRRRHRRSRRLRRSGGAARARLCAGADHAPGAGRFLGRRQDRDRFHARQKSHRRLPSADPGARRYRRARRAAAARIPRRLCRGRQIRLAWRCRVLRLAGGQLARRLRRRQFFRKFCARARHRRGCRAKAAIVARDERETGDRALAQSRPHFRPCAGSRLRLLRPAPAWRGDRRRHGARVRIFLAPAGACAEGRGRARHSPSGRGRLADASQGHPRPATFR